MKLQAWRTTGKNPCVDPPVYITIAPAPPYDSRTWFPPWVLPLQMAIEMFGRGPVEQIHEEPVEVQLHLMIPVASLQEPEKTLDTSPEVG